METQMLSFVVGTVCSLVFIGLGYTFVSVLMMKKQIRNLNEELNEAHLRLDEELKGVHLSLDECHNHADNIGEECHKRMDHMETRIDECYSYIDSRIDKQMDTCSNEFLDHSKRLAELETDKKVREDRIENYDQVNS